jgi:hypothetical protein
MFGIDDTMLTFLIFAVEAVLGALDDPDDIEPHPAAKRHMVSDPAAIRRMSSPLSLRLCVGRCYVGAARADVPQVRSVTRGSPIRCIPTHPGEG